MTTSSQNHEYALAIIERKHAEIVALTQRAEAAEAERDEMEQQLLSAERNALAVSLSQRWRPMRLDESQADCDALRAERDALREDAARLDWLESARHVCLFFDVDTNSHVTTIRDGVDGARAQRGATAKTIRAALDAALAVHPSTGAAT